MRSGAVLSKVAALCLKLLSPYSCGALSQYSRFQNNKTYPKFRKHSPRLISKTLLLGVAQYSLRLQLFASGLPFSKALIKAL